MSSEKYRKIIKNMRRVINKSSEEIRESTWVNMTFAFDILSLVDISLAAKLSAIDTTTFH